MFRFALSMWVQRRVDETWVSKLTELGRISEAEREIILSTPQSE